MTECSIPFDIQVEIIKRILDVKAVIRFRSVSKTWKSVIDSPWFIKDHTHQRQHHRHHLLVNFGERNSSHTFGGEQRYVSSVDDDSFQVSLLARIGIISPAAAAADVRELRTISSSHGLVCIYKRKKATAVIWNPSIRKSICIHVPNDDYNKGGVVGFGVCPGTLEPKLVKITWHVDDDDDDDDDDDYDDFTIPWQVEVFTLSSGYWRSINYNLPPPKLSRLRLQSKHVVVDGFIYWLSTYEIFEGNRRNMIMSFNLTTEEFLQVYLPDSLANHEYNDLDISTRMDSLVVIQNITNGVSWGIHTSGVWKMEEHSGVFTKLFNICIPADKGTPLCIVETTLCRVHGFRNNGEPIVELFKTFIKRWFYVNVRPSSRRRLYAYEPSSGRIKFTRIAVKRTECINCVSSYMETLLLLGHQDCKFDQQKLSTEIIERCEVGEQYY